MCVAKNWDSWFLKVSVLWRLFQNRGFHLPPFSCVCLCLFSWDVLLLLFQEREEREIEVSVISQETVSMVY